MPLQLHNPDAVSAPRVATYILAALSLSPEGFCYDLFYTVARLTKESAPNALGSPRSDRLALTTSPLQLRMPMHKKFTLEAYLGRVLARLALFISMSLTDELFSLQLPIRSGHLLAPGQGSRFPGSVERVLERGQADQRRVPGCQGKLSYNPNTLNSEAFILK